MRCFARSPEFTYRRSLLAARWRGERRRAPRLWAAAFTKVAGDAGVTVARRASIPIITGNSDAPSGAVGMRADASAPHGPGQRQHDCRVAAKTMAIGAPGSTAWSVPDCWR
ncbi:MAG: hypothetical protein IPF55_09590 [Rhodoferax sp.]|nr:hypothetical protein [Rhodoferax sp.]